MIAKNNAKFSHARPLSALLAGAILACAAGCGGPAPESSETGATADPSHGVSTDPSAATGFITVNAPPPETAVEKNGTMRDGDGRPYTYALLGRELPAFSGTLLSGEPFSSETIDQWTVIDMWGVWCGDCRVDGPYAAALADAIAEDDELAFVSIHTPLSAARASEAFGTYGSVDAYFEERGFSYPTLIDPDASIRDALEIAWTPSYLLVSPEGIVRGFRTDLSVSGSADPVGAFLDDIAQVRADLS
ncbi:MAG: TlpA disulfide reductase family protein [Pseudomonadota bacterium]